MAKILEFKRKGDKPRLVFDQATGKIDENLDAYHSRRIDRFKAHLARIEAMLAGIKRDGRVPETKE